MTNPAIPEAEDIMNDNILSIAEERVIRINLAEAMDHEPDPLTLRDKVIGAAVQLIWPFIGYLFFRCLEAMIRWLI